MPGKTEIPIEALCKMVGIERIMPVGEARRRMVQRKQHVRTILSNQVRCNADELKTVSHKSSKQSRRMARRLAAHYFNNLVVKWYDT